MSSHTKISRIKQQRIHSLVDQSDSYSFFNLLTSPMLLSKIEQLHPEHYRERQFPPTETLSMFLAQAMNADRSCQKVVNEAAIKRLISGLAPCSTATGGYCQARQRLATEMVSGLVRYIGELIHEELPERWLWHGKRVLLVDGTTVTFPDTKANRAIYPQQHGQKPGLGFPISRVLGVICLSSGTLVDGAMGTYSGKGSGEPELLRPMLGNFRQSDLLMGDACFGSYFLLASLQEQGVEALFEQLGTRKLVTDFRKGKRLGAKNHLIILRKPKRKPDWMNQQEYERAPEHITIRELKVKGKILITTLLSEKTYPKHELKDLYKKRWHVEVDLRNIKTTLGMETLSCTTPKMVEKEMWVYFLAYNLIRLLMAQAALLSDLQPRQLSFKHTVQLWLAWCQQTQAVDMQSDESTLFILIAQQTVGNRPGRIEPRAVKRRPKPFSFLTQKRELAREKVRRYGHPKKLK